MDTTLTESNGMSCHGYQPLNPSGCHRNSFHVHQNRTRLGVNGFNMAAERKNWNSLPVSERGCGSWTGRGSVLRVDWTGSVPDQTLDSETWDATRLAEDTGSCEVNVKVKDTRRFCGDWCEPGAAGVTPWCEAGNSRYREEEDSHSGVNHWCEKETERREQDSQHTNGRSVTGGCETEMVCSLEPENSHHGSNSSNSSGSRSRPPGGVGGAGGGDRPPGGGGGAAAGVVEERPLSVNVDPSSYRFTPITPLQDPCVTPRHVTSGEY